MEFFTEEELRVALENQRTRYQKTGSIHDAFYSIRDKLEHFSGLLSEVLGFPLVAVRKENIHKQAGRGKPPAFTTYVLVGYAPAGEKLGRQLFVKLEVLLYEDKIPKFKFELDYDYSSSSKPTPEPLRTYVDSIRDKALTFPVDSLEDKSWEGLLKRSQDYLERAFKDYRKAYRYFRASQPDEKENTSEPAPQEDKALSRPVNKILYGPPGTGKTFFLQNHLLPNYRDHRRLESREEFLDNMVLNLNWWEALALALLAIGRPARVTEIQDHEIVQARLKYSESKNPRAVIWGILQAHAPESCPNGSFNKQIPPFLFWKEKDSTWQIIREETVEQAPYLLEAFEQLRSFQSGMVQEKRFEFITFHQNYAYEDFVEGIKPRLHGSIDELEPAESGNSDLGFHLMEGIFFNACLEAIRLAGFNRFKDCLPDPDERKPEEARKERQKQFAQAKPYALFIDEINRANVSAVFGELITLLESDKRLGEANETILRLPYSKKLFGVPPNLHLYGTMNTADRSVEALDTALRRRFHFVEMAPQSDLLSPGHLIWLLWQKFKGIATLEDQALKDVHSALYNFLGAPGAFSPELQNKLYEELTEEWNEETFQDAIPYDDFTGFRLDLMLEAINQRIEKLIDRDHCLGHSFFMDVYKADDPLKFLQEVFANKVLPQLQEYFFGDLGKIGLVLGKAFVGSDQSAGKYATLEQAKSFFADFDYDKDLIRDHYNRRTYWIADPFELSLADFKAIYDTSAN